MGGDEKNMRQEKLPEEILASEKARSDLLRWKLVICAALGAAGFGMAGTNSNPHLGLLTLIPIACVYIDLLCTNINLRIILIGRFFAGKDDAYELFVGRHRVVFCLEDWALYGSTYVISGLLILLAIISTVLLSGQKFGFTGLMYLECGSILVASIVTMILTRWTQQGYKILLKIGPLDENINAEEYFIKQLSETNLRFKWFLLFAKRFVKGVAGASNLP